MGAPRGVPPFLHQPERARSDEESSCGCEKAAEAEAHDPMMGREYEEQPLGEAPSQDASRRPEDELDHREPSDDQTPREALDLEDGAPEEECESQQTAHDDAVDRAESDV